MDARIDGHTDAIAPPRLIGVVEPPPVPRESCANSQRLNSLDTSPKRTISTAIRLLPPRAMALPNSHERALAASMSTPARQRHHPSPASATHSDRCLREPNYWWSITPELALCCRTH